MKKLTNQFISIILILSMLFSLNVTAFATEHDNPVTFEVVTEFEDESVESIIRETYASLSPEMQTRVLQVIASNPELREYYQEEIDPSVSWQNYTPRAGVGISAVTRVASNDPIKNIERRLSKIGVPESVITEAILFAGALTLAAADGPLPFGDAISVYRGTKFAIVLGKNWTVVAPLFGTIAVIFKDELGNAVSGITKLFNQAKADAQKEADKEKKKKESEELKKLKERIPQIAITSWTRRGRQPRSRMEPQALSGTEGAAAVRLRIQRPGTIQTTPPGCGSRAFCGAVRSARQQRRGYPRR